MATEFTQLPLKPRLQKALSALELSTPTQVQSAAIPHALQNKDLLVSAATGSGKTLAFLLPLIDRLLVPPTTNVSSRGLILVPTRELAQQVFKVCERVCGGTGLKSVLLTGGQETRYQAALLRRDPDIIVATPGRLLEHLRRGAAVLSDIEMVVLDEADRMLDMGFRDDVQSILKLTPDSRQTLLLSATLGHSGVIRIAAEVLREPVTIDQTLQSFSDGQISQKMLLSDDRQHKQNQLLWLLGNIEHRKTIVFCNTRSGTEQLRSWLAYKDQVAVSLHGEIRQDDRKQVIQRFTHGAAHILVGDRRGRPRAGYRRRRPRGKF